MRPSYASFRLLLENSEALRELLSESATDNADRDDVVDVEELTASIDLIRQHFKISNSTPSNDEGESMSRSDAKGRNPGRVAKPLSKKPKTSANPWNKFMKLKPLKVPTAIFEYIKTHGYAAAPFFTRDATRHGFEDITDKNRANVFATSYRNTTQLQASKDMDKIIWLFHMLQYYDLGQIVRPGMKEVNTSFLSEIQAYIQPHLANHTTLNATKAAKDVYEWCAYGTKINVLVSEFGPGCIFVLADHLSADFIKKKMTQSGKHFKDAITHFRVMLQLETLIDESGVGKLGDALREFLIHPFQDCNKDKHEQAPKKRDGVPPSSLNEKKHDDVEASTAGNNEE